MVSRNFNAASGAFTLVGPRVHLRIDQLAAFLFTPFRTATVDNFLSAAFSSFRFVLRRRTMSSWPTLSPRRSAFHNAQFRNARRIEQSRRSQRQEPPCRRLRPQVRRPRRSNRRSRDTLPLGAFPPISETLHRGA